MAKTFKFFTNHNCEPGIGDRINFYGDIYKAVQHIQDAPCTSCELEKGQCNGLHCRPEQRRDGKRVVFVKCDKETI